MSEWELDPRCSYVKDGHRCILRSYQNDWEDHTHKTWDDLQSELAPGFSITEGPSEW